MSIIFDDKKHVTMKKQGGSIINIGALANNQNNDTFKDKKQ